MRVENRGERPLDALPVEVELAGGARWMMLIDLEPGESRSLYPAASELELEPGPSRTLHPGASG